MPTSRDPRTRSGLALWATAVLCTAMAVTGCGPDEPPDPAALFANNCAACHGQAADGVDDRGPSLLEAAYLIEALPDEALATAIREGVASSQDRWAPMPAFPRFDDAELEAVVGYVRELQRRAALPDS